MPGKSRAPSTKKANTEILKLSVLEEIKKRKDILFGKFSDRLDKQMKIAGWNEVLQKAQSVGLAKANRDWVFIRDSFWGQAKKNALKRRDNQRLTGTGGGEEYMLTDVDNMVLDIIGRESPAVQGLAVPQSGVPLPPRENHGYSSDDDEFMDIRITSRTPSPVAHTSAHTPTGPPEATPQRPIKRKVTSAARIAKKQELQIELLQHEIYLKKLKAAKLERELKICHSEYTQELPGINNRDPATFLIQLDTQSQTSQEHLLTE